jgi:chromosome segregation ATPase
MDDDADIGAELATALAKTRTVLHTRETDLKGLDTHLAKIKDSDEAAAKSAAKRLEKRRESHAKEAQLLREAVEALERGMEADDEREENFSALMSEKEFEIARERESLEKKRDEIADRLADQEMKLVRKLDVARQDVEMFKTQTSDAIKKVSAGDAEVKKLTTQLQKMTKSLKTATAELEQRKKTETESKKARGDADKLERDNARLKDKVESLTAEHQEMKKSLLAHERGVQQAIKSLASI